MDVDAAGGNDLYADGCQAMDVSETGASGGGQLRKVKKGRPMKRSMNARKKKALSKAVSQSEKSSEKLSRSETKILRTKSAKHLYD
ncbi:hypothetical protein M569_06522 [Genlisea aurea]|uniref:Uncharacterized protein n=1 Tax=Genlisea aurea TaxID=192259 RepID=S8DY90_9LAMI|nr:hypothetical protein M569_06522 [Genlisea aurea]